MAKSGLCDSFRNGHMSRISRICARFFLLLGFIYHTTTAGSNLPLLSGTLRTFQVHACDGNELKIECWPNTVINIYLAQYGRQVPYHQLCPPEGATAVDIAMLNYSTNCLSTQALRTVEESCREQRVCKVKTAPLTFGPTDPCPGVRKYAEVAYKCRPNVFSNKVVCEGDRLRLRCQRNLRIVIYSAAFGATHYGVPECPQTEGEGRIEDCQVSYATEAVMSSCHGRRKCSIGADIGTFGKPGCPTGTKLFLKVVHTCVPKEILKDLDLGGSDESKDQEDNDYTGFVEEPRYVPEATMEPLPDSSKPPVKDIPTLKPQLAEEGISTKVQQTTVKTDMQSDENNSSGEEEGENSGHVDGNRKVIGFLSEWFSAYNFIRDNKEKFILYLTLSLSVALVAILAILTTRAYMRRSRRLREETRGPTSKIPIPDSGGISPFGEECTDLDHFDNPNRDSDVVRFATRSSLRRSQPIEDDDSSLPRAPVRAQNNYYYS